jgi:hypothetical protein
MHLEIIDGQNNSREIYIDRELSERGVSPRDLILGCRCPNNVPLIIVILDFASSPEKIIVEIYKSIWQRNSLRVTVPLQS